MATAPVVPTAGLSSPTPPARLATAGGRVVLRLSQAGTVPVFAHVPRWHDHRPLIAALRCAADSALRCLMDG